MGSVRSAGLWWLPVEWLVAALMVAPVWLGARADPRSAGRWEIRHAAGGTEMVYYATRAPARGEDGTVHFVDANATRWSLAGDVTIEHLD